VAAAPLRRQLEKIAEAPVTLRTHLRNATFLAEAGPWLDATRLWAQSAIAALDALVEHREGAPGEAAHTARARALRTQAQAITIPSPTGPQAVAPGSGVLDALVHYALRGYGP
jgi:hyaluronoglucosaminidase